MRRVMYQSGEIRAQILEFDQAWDYMPVHQHDDPRNYHNIVVMRGRVAVFNEGMSWVQRVNAGEILDFSSWEPHGICAIEDGTKIANFLINPSLLTTKLWDHAHLPVEITRPLLDEQLRGRLNGIK